MTRRTPNSRTTGAAICSLVLLISLPTSAQETGSAAYYSDAGLVRDFANYLFTSGRYDLAADEYHRLLFLEGPERPTDILVQLARCRARTGAEDAAVLHLRDALANRPAASMRDSIAIGLTAVALRGQSTEFRSQYELSKSAASSPYVKSHIDFLHGLHLARSSEWSAAHDQFRSIGSTGSESLTEASAEMADLSAAAMNIKRRSPVGPVLLSAIIPGAGRMAIGRIGAGTNSFFLVASSAWLSYDGFRRGGTNSLQGWIFGLSSAVFYAANIYGTAVAVRLHNQKPFDDLENKVGAQISVWTRF